MVKVFSVPPKSKRDLERIATEILRDFIINVKYIPAFNTHSNANDILDKANDVLGEK